MIPPFFSITIFYPIIIRLSETKGTNNPQNYSSHPSVNLILTAMFRTTSPSISSISSGSETAGSTPSSSISSTYSQS